MDKPSLPRLFKERITLSTGYITNYWIVYFVFLSVIGWIAIYPVDSVIHPLNNWALVLILKLSVEKGFLLLNVFIFLQNEVVYF